jgi:Asp-tRNA(Asn)/Glu-tRNA(Gln) amidotransferase A subunit family amidase
VARRGAVVRRGEVTSRDVADAAFVAIERLNPKINAVTTLLHDLVDQILRDELPDGRGLGSAQVLADDE